MTYQRYRHPLYSFKPSPSTSDPPYLEYGAYTPIGDILIKEEGAQSYRRESNQIQSEHVRKTHLFSAN